MVIIGRLEFYSWQLRGRVVSNLGKGPRFALETRHLILFLESAGMRFESILTINILGRVLAD